MRASRVVSAGVIVATLTACGSSGSGMDAAVDVATSVDTHDTGATMDSLTAGPDVQTSDGSTLTDAADVSTDVPTDGTSGALAIGEWTDAPGACPTGTRRVDLRTNNDLADASRGQGAFASDGPGTCYFIHNGTYSQNGSVLMWFLHGGTAARPIYYIGESRAGVVFHARATVGTGMSNLVFQNLTFDLTGYSNGMGAFNTLDLLDSSNVAVTHCTFTGNCVVGHQGGHLETTGATHILIEANLIENYGACGPTGHLDHGIYLSAGADITVRNNVIRGNSSRGIQMYTASGAFGTLARVVIEQNQIYRNGHGAQEDGMVINGDATGTITNVTIRHNLIHDNYYSGIRFVGAATSAISIVDNTFYQNGAGGTASAPSEINVDVAGAASGDDITRNIFSGSTALINSNCYDATSRGLTLHDNVVQPPPSPLPPCVSNVVAVDPTFANTASADFHTRNPAVAGYGAYAP